jgi:hypothetical protein
MIIIGVDVGITGGLAVLEDGKLIALYPMPAKEVDYKGKTRKEVDGKLLYTLFERHNPNLVAIELVHAMPKNGATSMFRFGYSAGVVYGIACGFWQDTQIQFIRPQDWKKAMGLLKTSKNDAISKCLEVFVSHRDWFSSTGPRGGKDPSLSGKADAALIALTAYLDNEKE